MDRRQRKTREAVFKAFKELLAEEEYSKISVQEIIDKADIGRTTFYSHFDTKEDLLRELLRDLFSHVVKSALDKSHSHSGSGSVFCHLIEHIAENDKGILDILSSENSDTFLRYFKESLNSLMENELLIENREVPRDFLINHASSTFVEMILWWVKKGKKESAETLDRYFRLMILPLLQ